MSDICGFVLAGGRSSRMGEDKAELLLDGRRLVELAGEKLKNVAGQVRIVGPKAKFGNGAIEDVFRDRGPLGGIHAALTTTSAELNVILAVDLPFVEANLLNYVVRQAREPQTEVVVPRTADGYQPLCAVYRRSFAPVAEKALKAGRNKIDALFGQVRVKVIEEAELAKAGISVQQFRNVNTRADWEAARIQLAAR